MTTGLDLGSSSKNCGTCRFFILEVPKLGEGSCWALGIQTQESNEGGRCHKAQASLEARSPFEGEEEGSPDPHSIILGAPSPHAATLGLIQDGWKPDKQTLTKTNEMGVSWLETKHVRALWEALHKRGK